MAAAPDLGAATVVSLPLPRPLPDRLAGGGVVVLALVWSLAAVLANREAVFAAEMPLANALLLTTLGGSFTVAGVWFGVGAVVWAMGRLLGGKGKFLHVLLAVSAAAPPLWVAAPAVLLALTGRASGGEAVVLGLLATLGLVGFVALLVQSLGALLSFTPRRAWGCVALSGIFCASILSLQ